MVAIHFTVKTAEMNSVVNIVKRCTATNTKIILTSAKEVIETSSFVQSKEVLCRTTITFSKYTINQSINQSISFNSSNFLSLYIYTKRTQYAGYYRVWFLEGLYHNKVNKSKNNDGIMFWSKKFPLDLWITSFL